MLIPITSIHLRLANLSSGTVHAPRYVAAMLRIFLASRLDRDAPGNGIEVVESPDHTPVYRETNDVASEERFWKAFYGAAYDTAFPEGLSIPVRKLLEEDAARAARVARKGAMVLTPHDSFIRAGFSPPVAVACQQAGFPSLMSIPDDLLAVASIPGVDNLTATNLIAASKPVATPITVAPPLTRKEK